MEDGCHLDRSMTHSLTERRGNIKGEDYQRVIEEIQWDISFSESVQWVVEQEFHSHNESKSGTTDLADTESTLHGSQFVHFPAYVSDERRI